MSKFNIISAEPKTGSTWLANYLGGLPGVFAFHDGINGCSSLAEYKDCVCSIMGRRVTSTVVVDVTTVPKTILDPLIEYMDTDVKYTLDLPLFDRDHLDAKEVVENICKLLGVDFDGRRFQELIQYRVNSIPEMVDIDAGLSICEELGLIEREESDE